MRSATVCLIAIVSLVAIADDSSAQGYYHRTAGRNAVTGRQQIVDLHAPRWTGAGQGGYSFDPSSGSLQVTAITRNRATGRLEYHNQYLNPWTGARYTTNTQFNPYTRRYETEHNFAPPTVDPSAARENGSPLVVETLPLTRRRPRIIETKAPPAETPVELNPPTGEPPVTPATETSESDSEFPQPAPAVTIEIRNP